MIRPKAPKPKPPNYAKLQSRLPARPCNNARQLAPLAAVFALVACLGVYYLVAPHAATLATPQNVKSGTVASKAAISSNSAASNGPAAKFGGAGSSSCPSGHVEANDGSCVALPSGTTKLVFDDEFNSTSVNSTIWKVLDVHGDRSNNEPECYSPANIRESGGFLNELLTAKRVTCPIDTSNGGSGTLSSRYSSGAIQMKSFDFEYGTLQARVRFAGGSGSWPALWMLGQDCQLPDYLTTTTCNWPNTGSQEIDVAEFVSGRSINQEIWNGSATPNCNVSISTAATVYHLYSMMWSPGKIVFQIDGTPTCTLTSSVPANRMFVIINTAVGGNGGGTIDDSTLPQTTSVDYVRVFQ